MPQTSVHPFGVTTTSVPSTTAQPWTPTPLNWSVEFPRSPQHLSNQLRGKRFYSERLQLDLFDTTYQKLPAEIRADVDKHNISVVGFDLTIPQQRALDSALFLLTASGAKSQRIVFSPDDWLRAYGLEKRQRSTRGWSEVSSFERDEAFAALVSLGVLPWLIQYQSQVNGKWGEVTRVAPLWLCATRRDDPLPTPSSARVLNPEDIAPLVHKFKNADLIELQFNEIFMDQSDCYYFYKPAHLYQRLSLVISGNMRRRNRHLHAFMDWIFSEVGRIRVAEKQAKADQGEAYAPRSDWSFSEELAALALQLRMTAQVSKRNWSRIRQGITDNAVMAKEAQIISAYEWRDERLYITFNQKSFTDLDQYHQALQVRQAERARRQHRRRVLDVPFKWPFPRPVGDYTPNQLKDMKRGQLQRLAEIRARLREEGTIPRSYAATMTPRAPTPDEARAIAFHDATVRMIDEALVPSPPKDAV